ncbi:hypothetical protein Nepgr_005902 [Nepenthes gracilis]|uniref:Serpin domain-containing protein n=1 Tax=Nepenthes gracilis TaxID=150966 RepID=A0AAD3XGW5_NEPGR|nr:hypothetical protein Nepgr_005902 [Nepenthes gracilis]
MKPPQYMPRRNPCSIDSLYSRIAVVEKLLRRLLGNTTHEPQNRLSGFLKAKVKASTVVRFQFELEMDVPTDGFRQGSQPKWRTKCSIERGWFDVVARVDRECPSTGLKQRKLDEVKMDLRQLIIDQTDVSLTVTKHLSSIAVKDGANLVFSPLSIHAALSLIAAGSSGRTLAQLHSFLKSSSSDNLNKLSSELVFLLADASQTGGPKLSFANGIWIDRTFQFLPTFKQIVDDVYKAASNQVDFQTKAVEVTSEVNSWFDKETDGLIKDVLPPGSVDSMTRLIFANALYFKGAWNEKFDASKTRDHDFHLLNGSSIKVPFLTSKKKQLIRTFDGFKVLGLPYKQGGDKRHFTMYVLLPDAKDGLAALVEKVSSKSSFLDRHIPNEQVEVGDFRIPRFKISFGFEASDVLKGLGLTDVFSGGGLTEMVASTVGGHNLYLSSIFQKSFVEVNEEGTEAAAASAATISLRSIRFEDKVDFVADHPFIFMIREDNTGVLLLIGHVLNALAG